MNSKLFDIVSVLGLAVMCLIPSARADEAIGQSQTSAPDVADKTPSAAPSEADRPGGQSSVQASATAGAGDVLPGPLFNDRRALFGQIQQAGQHGIGTASYKMAFRALEDQVAAGATEDKIKSRVDELNSALKEQLKRAQILKTQRPLPPAAPPQADSSPPPSATPVATGGLGSLGNSALLDKLKDKLGSGGMPSSDVVDKFLNSDKAKDLLKRLGQ